LPLELQALVEAISSDRARQGAQIAGRSFGEC
jgi:hypothetical protein